MILEEIKNSIQQAIYAADSSIIFHYEEISHTGFPCAILSLKDFKIIPSVIYDKEKCEFNFELVYMYSKDNNLSKLMEGQEILTSALLPVVSVLDKKITLDDVNFFILNKKLIMNFKMNFYTYEQDGSETMETLDITIKGE